MTRSRRPTPRKDYPYGGVAEWFQELWFPFDRVKELHTQLDPGEPPPPPDPDEPPPPEPLPCTPEFDTATLAQPYGFQPPRYINICINNGGGFNGPGIYIHPDQCCPPMILNIDGSEPINRETLITPSSAFIAAGDAKRVTIEYYMSTLFGVSTWKVNKYNKVCYNHVTEVEPDAVFGGSPASVEWVAEDSLWVPGDGAHSCGTIFEFVPIILHYSGHAIIKVECPSDG